MDLAECLEDSKALGAMSALCSLELASCRSWGRVRVAIARGCGRRLALVNPGSRGDLESFLYDAASGRIPWVSGCSLAGELEVAGYGLRGLLARGDGVFVKLSTLAADDVLEYKVLEYLSSVEPGIAPRPVCEMRVDGIPLGVAMELVEGEPLALEYISSALAGREPASNRLLGESVARLHLALARCREEWCAPRPASRGMVEEWVGRVMWRARLLRRLARSEDLDMAEALDSLEELSLYMAEAAGSLEGATVHRIHGDLHLYQVYRAGSRLVFTDFEGEPYREPARRDALEPPVRDLATLVRSIDYASTLALMERGMDAFEASVEASRGMAGWRESVARGLIDSYTRIARGAGVEVGDWSLGLAFWMAERASYELVYEVLEATGLHYIPLNALLRIRDSWPRVAW